MVLPKSRLGALLAVAYLLVTFLIVYSAYQCSPRGNDFCGLQLMLPIFGIQSPSGFSSLYNFNSELFGHVSGNLNTPFVTPSTNYWILVSFFTVAMYFLGAGFGALGKKIFKKKESL
jgi:hypothetical protein